MADSRSAHAKSHSRSSAPPPTAPQNRTQSLSSAAPAPRNIPKPQESGQSPKLARSVSKTLGLSAGGSSSRSEQRSEGSSNSSSRMLGPVVEMQPVVQQQQPSRVKMNRPVSATPELSRERDRELRKSAKTPTLAPMAEAPASRLMRPKSTTAEMMLRDDGRSGSLRAKSSSELQQQPPASRPSHHQSGAADSGTGSLRASAASPAFPGEKKTMIKYMLHEVRELKRQVDPNATDAVTRRHGGDSSERQRSSRGDSQEDVRSPGSHSQSHSQSGSMSRLNESPASSTGGFRVGTPKSALSYKQRLLGRLQKYAVCLCF